MKRYFSNKCVLSCFCTILSFILNVAYVSAEYVVQDSFVMDVYSELNLARTQPQEYATYLEDALKRFDGNVYVNSDGRRFMTYEGRNPYREAIDILKNMQPLGNLSLEKGLCLSSQDLSDAHVKTGNVNFTLPDGTDVWENAKKYYFANSQGMTLSYPSSNAREMIISLLVDDGLSTRDNRKYLLNPEYRYVGVGFSKGGKHPYGASCVITFASYYLDISLSLDKIADAPYANNRDYIQGYDPENQLLREIQRELNMVRCNPKDYAERYIRPILDRFSGDHMLDYDGSLRKAYEGKACIEECIKVLEKTEPCNPLSMEKALCDAAAWFSKDIVRHKIHEHTASDGSSPSDRVKRFGFQGGAGENISFTERTAREIVIVLLIDDQVPSRGHRNNILNPRYTKVGIGISYGSDLFSSVCVMDFAF